MKNSTSIPMINIFLDDIRYPPDEFNLVFRSGEELIAYFLKNPGEHYNLLSFDHDLGENCMDGYDVVKEIINNSAICFTFGRLQFHTDNFEGFRNMYNYAFNASNFGLFNDGAFVDPIKKNVIDGIVTDSIFRIR